MDGWVYGEGVTSALIFTVSHGIELGRELRAKGLGEDMKCFNIQGINLECHRWDGWW